MKTDTFVRFDKAHAKQAAKSVSIQDYYQNIQASLNPAGNDALIDKVATQIQPNLRTGD